MKNPRRLQGQTGQYLDYSVALFVRIFGAVGGITPDEGKSRRYKHGKNYYAASSAAAYFASIHMSPPFRFSRMIMRRFFT